MGKHRQQLDSQECNRLSVDREQFWEDCVVFFKTQSLIQDIHWESDLLVKLGFTLEDYVVNLALS